MKVRTWLLARVNRFNKSSFCLFYLKLVFPLRVCLGQESSRETAQAESSSFVEMRGKKLDFGDQQSFWTSLVAQMVKHLAYNAEDLGSIPGSGRFSGEENGNPLQYSCLENPMDKGAWGATVRGIAKESDTCQHTHRHLYGSCTRGWIQAASLVD